MNPSHERHCGVDTGRRARWLSVAHAWSPVLLVAGLVLAPYVSYVTCPEFADWFVRSRARAEEDIARMSAAVHEYFVLNGGKPPESLAILLDGNDVGRPLLPGQTSIPLDPWGVAYRYDCDSQHGRYRVYTLGRDNAPGGTGADADIDNFTIAAARR